MAENPYAAGQLDLTKILQTLASLPQQNNPGSTHAQSNSKPPPPPQQQQQEYDPCQPPLHPAQSYNPSNLVQANQLSNSHAQNPSRDPRLAGRTNMSHRSHTTQPISQKPLTPVVDPTTITEWKHGLRCVSKLAESNPSFDASIQKLIKNQQRNIRDWTNGHARLVEEQTAKRESELAHRAAISLTGILENTPLLRTAEREQEELDVYYGKVYRAQEQMGESHSQVLERLGVPFFGTKPALLLADSEVDDGATGGGQVKINKKQLLELQKKMLTHLNELYGE